MEAALSEESLAHSNGEESTETSASTEESESEPTHSSSNDDLKNSEQRQHRKKRRPKKKVWKNFTYLDMAEVRLRLQIKIGYISYIYI